MAQSLTMSAERPLLMLVTEPGPRLIDIVVAAVDGGVDIVQWRDKTASIDDLIRFVAPDLIAAVGGRATIVANLATPPASVIAQSFNPRIDGLHFPEGAAEGDYIVKTTKFAEIDRIVTTQVRCHGSGKRGITGESIHSVDAAKRAEDAGADYVVAGAIFETRSHPGQPSAGLGFLADICRTVSIPVIAIGGITPDNAHACIDAGAAEVAVLSKIMRSNDPRATALSYRSGLAPVR